MAAGAAAGVVTGLTDFSVAAVALFAEGLVPWRAGFGGRAGCADGIPLGDGRPGETGSLEARVTASVA